MNALARSVSASGNVMRIRVHYPPAEGDIALLTEPDWAEPLSAVRQTDSCVEFELPGDREFRYFKPVLRNGDETRWSAGDNYLALASAPGPIDVYPHFQVDDHCSACALRELTDPVSGKTFRFRIFYPPGYHENTLARYPVLYMQDGQNLFFPNEAFQGQHWKIAETLHLLDSMNAAAKVIVVGVYPNDREHDYTQSGYTDYGRFLVEHLKPFVDREYRTQSDATHTGVMGSSLGGVVSFYLAWEYSEVFGMAACMSSTFGFRDNLLDRVRAEPKRAVRYYLDSGWPRDNYEVTREMRLRLHQRGYIEGKDLIYYAYPQALHNEAHWAMRTHIPFQIFFGANHSTAPVELEVTRQ